MAGVISMCVCGGDLFGHIARLSYATKCDCFLGDLFSGMLSIGIERVGIARYFGVSF